MSGHDDELRQVVRPYGDTTGDGRVQVSFTLPVPSASEADRLVAEGAALQLAGKMGLAPAFVAHVKAIGPDFTFFIVYGRVSHLVDLSLVTVAARERALRGPSTASPPVTPARTKSRRLIMLIRSSL